MTLRKPGPHRPPRLRGLPAAVLPVVALALSLAACGGDEPQAAPEPTVTPPTAPPPPAPPKVGECHRMSFAMAAQPTSRRRPVPCSRRHTAVTIFVGRIDTVSDGHLLAIDSERVLDRIARSCPQPLAEHLGGDTEARRLSRFETVWFSPTFEQADRGAVWFRCDLIALAGRDRLLELPRHTRGILDSDDVLDRFGTCGTSSPVERDFVRVACGAEHSWRAVSTVELDPRAKYLGEKAGAVADDACRDVAADRSEDALKFSWSFEWPTRAAWESGQRYGYCWLPTER